MRISEFRTEGTERIEKITCECGHTFETGCHVALYELFNSKDIKSDMGCPNCGKYE